MTEKITPEVVAQHGLTQGEYDEVKRHLGREPNLTELGVFSVMWSEHCSYKSSRVHLKTLPTKGPRVIQGPGENAGVVDIGDGLAAAFKMESHNHPSFIEPYQGAATGVGGILRDVFTMGARPIASANSLRFGDPSHPRTAYLLEGVVAGIGGYGNCMGVPTVGGEVMFHPSYNGNCLVNAFTLGILPADKIFLGTAAGVGNPVMYIGAKTGRDGIHGATMASAEFDASTEEKRPTVQVGDPFMEKLLLEACLELFKTDAVVGIQDMGAAGLTSSSVEMAGRAGNGLDLFLDQVPLREEGMTPYEILLSESQERMLLVAAEGKEDVVRRICTKWDLDVAIVGRVTDTGRWRAHWHGKLVADLPVDPLTEGAPRYQRPMKPHPALPDLHAFDVSTLPEPADLGGALLRLLARPTIASKEWVYQQYDHMVRLVGAVRPGGDAAVVRIATGDARYAKKAVAISVGANGRYCFLDPHLGAAARGRRVRPQHRVRGRRAHRHHRLPQLRQPGEAGDHVAVRRVRARHRRRLPRARDARRVRQRLALQRDRGPGDPAHADDRDGRPRAGRREDLHERVQERRATSSRWSGRSRARWAAPSTSPPSTARRRAARPRSTSRRRRRCRRRCAAPCARGCSRRRTTAPTAASRWRWRSAA